MIFFLENKQPTLGGNVCGRQGLLNKSLKSRNSATAGNNKGKAPKLRIGCPACVRKGSSADDFTYVSVASGAKRAKCPAGHYFMTDGKSIPGNQNIVLNLAQFAS